VVEALDAAKGEIEEAARPAEDGKDLLALRVGGVALVRLIEQAFSEEAQQRGVYLAIATHDEALLKQTCQFIKEHKISPSTYEFQMLYGIRRDLQECLSQAGHVVRVYVSYGEAWYPYFMRRLAERPANVLFLLKNLIKG